MALNASDYRHQLSALQPPGRALPGDTDSDWQQLLRGLAEELARIDGRADDLMREADPRTAFELLEEWESLVGLPDDCVGTADHGLGERRAEVETRITARGAQNKAYFLDIADRLGFDIEIEEPPVSVSGGLVAGDELSASHSDRYAWRARVTLQPSSAFIAGNAVAGDELGYWRPTELECLLARLKPAHTMIDYEYLIEEE